jgi:hypothetical protein
MLDFLKKDLGTVGIGFMQINNSPYVACDSLPGREKGIVKIMGVFLYKVHGMAQNFPVKLLLASEVIGDHGGIDSRTFRDLPNGNAEKSLEGEKLLSFLDKPGSS